MSNKSSKSPSGENPEKADEHMLGQEVEARDIAANSGVPGTNKAAAQENLQNRGYEEDQPKNPVRGTGSTKNDQESLPTGEPDPNEI